MKLMNLKLSTLIIRFYLMMGIIIAALFIGYPLLSLFALPVFYTALMGIQFNAASTDKKVYPVRHREFHGSHSQAAH